MSSLLPMAQPEYWIENYFSVYADIIYANFTSDIYTLS
jgi:hypothetical protein